MTTGEGPKTLEYEASVIHDFVSTVKSIHGNGNNLVVSTDQGHFFCVIYGQNIEITGEVLNEDSCEVRSARSGTVRVVKSSSEICIIDSEQSGSQAHIRPADSCEIAGFHVCEGLNGLLVSICGPNKRCGGGFFKIIEFPSDRSVVDRNVGGHIAGGNTTYPYEHIEMAYCGEAFVLWGRGGASVARVGDTKGSIELVTRLTLAAEFAGISHDGGLAFVIQGKEVIAIDRRVEEGIEGESPNVFPRTIYRLGTIPVAFAHYDTKAAIAGSDGSITIVDGVQSSFIVQYPGTAEITSLLLAGSTGQNLWVGDASGRLSLLRIPGISVGR